MSTSAQFDVKAVVFDCGGVLAEDCPVLCYQHLAETRYPPSERARISDMHKRNYQLWNRFKVEKGYTETMYWSDLIANGTNYLNHSLNLLAF